MRSLLNFLATNYTNLHKLYYELKLKKFVPIRVIRGNFFLTIFETNKSTNGKFTKRKS